MTSILLLFNLQKIDPIVTINANLDLKTNDVLNTGRLNKALSDLFDGELGITFVARDRAFLSEAWRDNGKTYMRVVLPYEEVLRTNNIDLLAYQQLYLQLDQLAWLDVAEMKRKLEKKMARIS